MKKILIVDDEPLIVRLIATRLKANGYEVFLAYDGLACIQIAQKEFPDLILLDLQLPAGGGVHTFDNLKASVYTSAIPILFISTIHEKEVSQLIMEMGADGFIQKNPINLSELLKMIKDLIGE